MALDKHVSQMKRKKRSKLRFQNNYYNELYPLQLVTTHTCWLRAKYYDKSTYATAKILNNLNVLK